MIKKGKYMKNSIQQKQRCRNLFILMVVFICCHACHEHKRSSQIPGLLGHKGLLNKYDTIALISATACSACIESYVNGKQHSDRTVFVYDETSGTSFVHEIGHSNHIHMPQLEIAHLIKPENMMTLLVRSPGEYEEVPWVKH
jgi:hypothetical protein